MARLIKPMLGRGRVDPGTPEERDLSAEYKMAIGKWLRKARHAARMTQKEVADRLGIGDGSYSHYECGRNSVNPEHYAQIADILGVSRQEMGKYFLRYNNPWIYALIYGRHEATLEEHLELMQSNVGEPIRRGD